MPNIKVPMDYLIATLLDRFVAFSSQTNEKLVLVDAGMALFSIYFVHTLDGSWVRILREISHMGCRAKNIFNSNSLKKYYPWKYEFEYFEPCVFQKIFCEKTEFFIYIYKNITIFSI